jgi:hypothetical protein
MSAVVEVDVSPAISMNWKIPAPCRQFFFSLPFLFVRCRKKLSHRHRRIRPVGIVEKRGKIKGTRKKERGIYKSHLPNSALGSIQICKEKQCTA